MQVTTLVENDPGSDRTEAKPAFGLSLLVETARARVLFDTGPSAVFADNAEVLGIDLSRLDAAVLSHHHFDHGGGLARFFEINDSTPVVMRSVRLAPRWFKGLAFLRRSIGIDLELVEQHRERFQSVDGSREIAPGCHVLTGIGSQHPRPRGNRYLFVESDGGLEPDPFDHELVLVVVEDDGMAVFTGCSHCGVLNMVDAARAAFPEAPVKAVFGGFHLIGIPLYESMAASREEVRAMGRAMLDRVSGTTYTGHCTGRKGYRVLESVMGEALAKLDTASRVEV